MRAGFHDMSLATTQGDLIRAVLEGVAYNNLWLLDAVEKFVGGRLDNIRFIGGGAQSDSVVPDPRRRDGPHHRTGRRPALLRIARRGAERGDGARRGASRTNSAASSRCGTPTVPMPANRAAYDRLYAEFPGLYTSQKKFFRRLNR